MGWFITHRMVLQETRLTNDTVQSLLRSEQSLQEFAVNTEGGPDAATDSELARLAALPDLLRLNIYGRDGRVIWSSDRQLTGRHLGANADLERAMNGTIAADIVEDASHHEPGYKPEHRELKRVGSMFVEMYMPVRDTRGEQVLAVMERYKNPRALTQTLREMRWWIALGFSAGGVLLFLALIGLVLRADRTFHTRQAWLVERETLATIGEMSSVVAHGLRNPLASISSSAELMQEDPAFAPVAAIDIVVLSATCTAAASA